jgi:hypothetical protein
MRLMMRFTIPVERGNKTPADTTPVLTLEDLKCGSSQD